MQTDSVLVGYRYSAPPSIRDVLLMRTDRVLVGYRYSAPPSIRETLLMQIGFWWDIATQRNWNR